MEMNYGKQELNQLEEEIHTDIVPGTEIMADIGTRRFVKARSHVLVPQPSSDPHDPLNWSPAWKASTIIASTAVSFTLGFGPLSLAPMFPYYIEEFDSNLTDVVKFTGNTILVLGFSNFIWVPISTAFGRRPVYIFSQLICLGASIWQTRATSYSSYMGACILNGIGSGPSESLQPAVIADIFFLHDRGFWNTFYWVLYLGSLMISPVVSGAMSLHVGWRNFWNFNTGLVALSLLMTIFMFPETKWHRAHPNEVADTFNQRASPDDSDGKVESNSTHGELRHSDIGSAPDALTGGATHGTDPHLGKGSPNKQQWALYQPNAHPFKSILNDLLIPWKLFSFPIVVFAGLIVGFSCSSFLAVNITQSQNFSVAPYNYDSQTIGFMNFAVLIGALIGLATAGPLSDWVSARATRNNKGIREPEMRLPAMIPYALIMILGSFIVAFGYQQKWSWEAIVIVGYACSGIQVAALPAMATTYAVDSYKPVAGSLMVAITVIKNLWGYGCSSFVTPWVEQSGFVPPIMTIMSLITLWCLCAILFYFKGKTFRRWSRNDSVHKM